MFINGVFDPQCLPIQFMFFYLALKFSNLEEIFALLKPLSSKKGSDQGHDESCCELVHCDGGVKASQTSELQYETNHGCGYCRPDKCSLSPLSAFVFLF